MSARSTTSALLIAVALATSGCVMALVPEEDRLLPAGRYSELERLMESRIKNLAQAKSNQLWYLCSAYSRLKKYDKLFPCLDQLDRNIAAGDNVVNFYDMSAWTPLLRAQTAIEFGDYPKAVAEAQKAWDVVVKKDLARYNRIYVLGSLALAHTLNGDRENGRRYAAMLDDVGTAYPFTLLATPKMTELAKVYAALGEYDKSLQALRLTGTRGFETFVDVTVAAAGGGSTSYLTFATLPREVMVAKALLETGATADARAKYDELLARRETAYNGDLYWLALFDRGRIAEREGQSSRAIDLYVKAVDVIEQQRSTINTEVNKIGFVGNKQDVYGRLIALLVAAGQARTAFEYAERAKSRALVDLLAARTDYDFTKGPSQGPFTPAVPTADAGRVQRTLTQLAKAEADARVQETTETGPELERRRTRTIAVTEELKAVAPDLASLVTVTRIAAAELQALLAPDERLLEYYYQGDDAYAFVVSRQTSLP